MRRGLRLAACLLLWLFPGGTALGAEDTAAVYDYAGLLSSSETAALEENARDFSDSWNMNVVFLTTDDTGDKDSESYADDFYMDNGYYDNGMDGGILFLIDMDNRQVWISTAHDMRYYLTDERLEDVIDAGYEELTEEKYALCFENMLDETERFMEKGIDSRQYLYDRETGEIKVYRSITLGEGLFAALAALAAGAAAVGCVLVRYRVRLSSYTYPWREKCRFRVKHKDSRLVNQFVTKRRLPEQNPPDHGGGGGGGGRTTTHTSSGGGSFGGGGRSF